MERVTIEQFIERLQNDDALRQTLIEAERAAARDINSGTDTITQIAAQEGLDLNGWPGRPITEMAPETERDFSLCCTLTCCLWQTSAAIVEEADTA